MHLTHGQAGPGPRCSGRCRGRGKARGAHEPLPRLCAGPRHRINGEAVPLPHPRQGTPSPGTGNQARVPVDEDSAPYSVEDSGADDGAPGFVGPPDEPVLPFSGWISSTQTQIWRATSTPARSRPPNRSWSWARYGRAARPRQACGGRHQLYAAHRGEPQPRTRWCPKRATMGTCGSGVLRTRTETSLGGATTVVAPPNDNAKHEPLCYFTATNTLSSRRPGCTASTPSCAVAEGIDSTVFPVTLPPL